MSVIKKNIKRVPLLPSHKHPVPLLLPFLSPSLSNPLSSAAVGPLRDERAATQKSLGARRQACILGDGSVFLW